MWLKLHWKCGRKAVGKHAHYLRIDLKWCVSQAELLSITKIKTEPQCPSKESWLNTLGNINTVEYWICKIHWEDFHVLIENHLKYIHCWMNFCTELDVYYGIICVKGCVSGILCHQIYMDIQEIDSIGCLWSSWSEIWGSVLFIHN